MFENKTFPIKPGLLITPSLLIIVGIVLRCYGINDLEVWMDEAIQREWSQFLPMSDLAYNAYTHLVRLSIWILGIEPWALRFTSLMSGIFFMIIIYRLVKENISSEAALYTLSLTATSYYLLYYSQENRSYAFTLLLLLIGWRTVLNWSERIPDRGVWILPAIGIVTAASQQIASMSAFGLLLFASIFAFARGRIGAAILQVIGMLGIVSYNISYFYIQWWQPGPLANFVRESSPLTWNIIFGYLATIYKCVLFYMTGGFISFFHPQGVSPFYYALQWAAFLIIVPGLMAWIVRNVLKSGNPYPIISRGTSSARPVAMAWMLLILSIFALLPGFTLMLISRGAYLDRFGCWVIIPLFISFGWSVSHLRIPVARAAIILLVIGLQVYAVNDYFQNREKIFTSRTSNFIDYFARELDGNGVVLSELSFAPLLRYELDRRDRSPGNLISYPRNFSKTEYPLGYDGPPLALFENHESLIPVMNAMRDDPGRDLWVLGSESFFQMPLLKAWLGEIGDPIHKIPAAPTNFGIELRRYRVPDGSQ